MCSGPLNELGTCRQFRVNMIGRDEMSRTMIPVEESFAWRKDPEYEEAYNALEEEFALAAAMIEARARAGLTQQQLAERMHSTQAVIARLESGKVKPSTRTLERLPPPPGQRGRVFFWLRGP